MWVLLGVAVVVVGFAARLNPLLIVALALSRDTPLFLSLPAGDT